MTGATIWHIEEPQCVFGYGQTLDHPKDGLSAFGPPDQKGKPRHIRVGVVGTVLGISLLKDWLRQIQRPVLRDNPDDANQSSFPGFDAAFRCRLDPEPAAEIPVSSAAIEATIMKKDRHQAVFSTVSLFEEPIRSHIDGEDTRPDIWFVIVPDVVYEFGRPKSRPPVNSRTEVGLALSHSRARRLHAEPSLFADENTAAEAHRYERDFHDQLKGRLLDCRAILQVVRERTLMQEAADEEGAQAVRGQQKPLEIAWNLSTAAYYKAGGQPWRLNGIRHGVCYIGMVYKQVDGGREGNACCGAQMFLHAGDGLVFKGAVGNWYSPDTKEFHLDRASARALMERAIQGYREKNGELPVEIFIHGKAYFTNDEWAGFQDAVPDGIKLVGIRIRRAGGLKLYGPGSHPVLRGTAMRASLRRGYLWTLGYVPRLGTYPGREVPNPLVVEVCRGDADLETVMRDVLGLTKVNFNACIYGDGLPVTIRFADRVGDVLTAIPPDRNTPPLPFRHYI